MSHGMHEFRIHHLVSELMNLLGANTSDKPGADTYTDLLQKNMTPYITTQVSAHNAKKKIMESAGASSIEFLSKYDELKSKNVRDLDSLTYLLSRLCDDEMTKLHLKKHAEERAAASGVSLTKPVNVTSSLPEPGTKMTPDEFEKLRENLMKASSAPIAKSDAMKKALKERQTKNVNIPVQPDWIFQRPYLTMDFVPDQEGFDEPAARLGNLPVDEQEDAIIEDLLFCMEGLLGKYIIAQPLADRYAKLEFSVNSSLDPSRKELVKRILPLCSNYSTVVRFIEEKSAFEYGLVNHALGSAMRTLVKDYLILVAQLENQFRKGQLTLLRLWFYIQPTMRVLEILASVANSINKGECIGGAVLSLLHEKTASLVGDAKAQELCLFLTQSACVPYFEILERWIYKGVINDPYCEFLVEENEAFQKENLQEDYNDSYWEQHYTIRRERIPIFLEQVADKILNTGKYLNVVRQCGRDVRCPSAEEMVYTIKERQYCEQIENAYSYASKLLLNLLMEDYQLMDRLRSIKHYFLLDQGDFVVQFMDMSDEEMKKPMDEILISRLESLLELAQRTSTANVDPFKDDLKVELLPYDLISQLFKILSIETKREKDFKANAADLHLSGLESFTFDYIVKWPVSLVLNRKALTRYQMLFRHLFYCKHVERQLCSVWLSNKTAKMYQLHSTKWFAAAFALRQRMLNFVQNFEYYMMVEVIEPNWHVFVTNMDSASNMDDVLNYHNDLLNNCLKDCMLTSPELLKIVHKLMMVCVTFSNFIQRLNQSTNVELEASKLTPTATLQAAPTERDRKQDPEQKKSTAKAVREHVDQMAGSENFERTIAKFDGNFSRFLIDLLDRIMDDSIQTYEVKFMNIVHRLNFNGFYRESLETLSAERSMMEAKSSSARP